MMTLRPAAERGHFNHGWLDTYHSFSFGQYQDPAHMQFRSLRVMNEDVIDPGMGFGMHGHTDMEIITYVVGGAIKHADSMGNESIIPAGGFQRMTAGSGVRHSEFNPSSTEPTHIYQIWILPDTPGLAPEFEEMAPDPAAAHNGLRLVAGPAEAEGGMVIHQDARLFHGRLDPGVTVEHAIAPGRHAWVQTVAGGLTVNGLALAAGDGAAISEESAITIAAGSAGTEVLLFDLA